MTEGQNAKEERQAEGVVPHPPKQDTPPTQLGDVDNPTIVRSVD